MALKHDETQSHTFIGLKQVHIVNIQINIYHSQSFQNKVGFDERWWWVQSDPICTGA